MIATAWKYKWGGSRCLSMNKPWPDGNFCVKHEKVQNLSLPKAEACPCMGYADRGHRMTNGHSISQRAWRWTKNYFFTCCIWLHWIVPHHSHSPVIATLHATQPTDKRISNVISGELYCSTWVTYGISVALPGPWYYQHNIPSELSLLAQMRHQSPLLFKPTEIHQPTYFDPKVVGSMYYWNAGNTAHSHMLLTMHKWKLHQ